MAMGGVGEAMLLGAAMGGGSAALTGGDPLKGALLGGLTGSAGAGISEALRYAAAGTEAALVPAVAGTQAATSAIPAATSVASGTAATAPATSPFLTSGPMSAADTFRASISSASPAIPGGTIAPNVGSFSPPAATGGISNLTAADPKTFTEGMSKFASDPLASIKANKGIALASALQGATGARKEAEEPGEYNGPLKRFRYNPDMYRPAFAEGGIANLATGGYDRVVGDPPMSPINFASGGISNLGSYSDYANGGRMLKGPGDGMSDSIPASIGGKRPARLAEGEFVVPADVVSHLGNGSTDAGAKQLYAMMNKVRQARTGSKRQGKEINPRRFVPA